MFTEVADRVWVARHAWFDVNVSLVGGEAGLVLVDTHASGLAARAVVDDVRRLGRGEVVAVVNTHEHFDHTFGNATVREAWPAVALHAHEEAAARTLEAGERVKARYAEGEDPHREEVLATEVLAAERTFSSATTLDLGDRFVELVHPGRGHTSGDLVVRVPDADLVLAGDLVEESTVAGGPGFGEDCWPLEWPHSLDIVLGLLTSTSTVVPGHGAPVDRDFVEEQRNAIGVVAQTVRDLAARGVPASQALEATTWPYPAEHLVHAVNRGYAHLSRGEKRLPMV
ncbi:MBL fold metallo-hydrolase [Nocardioides nanhaiensis]|uniref:MBL fold metallo-hydrolase n=1 Tax=Nocardioides nanhaiensis TaxID=1476871 RepID=A0ABP8WS19_9ACTN